MYRPYSNVPIPTPASGIPPFDEIPMVAPPLLLPKKYQRELTLQDFCCEYQECDIPGMPAPGEIPPPTENPYAPRRKPKAKKQLNSSNHHTPYRPQIPAPLMLPQALIQPDHPKDYPPQYQVQPQSAQSHLQAPPQAQPTQLQPKLTPPQSMPKVTPAPPKPQQDQVAPDTAQPVPAVTPKSVSAANQDKNVPKEISRELEPPAKEAPAEPCLSEKIQAALSQITAEGAAQEDEDALFETKTPREIEAFDMGYAEGFCAGFAKAWAKAQEAVPKPLPLYKRIGHGLKKLLSIVSGLGLILGLIRKIKELKLRHEYALEQSRNQAVEHFKSLTPSQQAKLVHQGYAQTHPKAPSFNRQNTALAPTPLWPRLMLALRSLVQVLFSRALVFALLGILFPLTCATYAAIFWGWDIRPYFLPLYYELSFLQGHITITELFALQHWVNLLHLIPLAALVGVSFGCCYGYQHCGNLASRSTELALLKKRASHGYIIALAILLGAIFFFTIIALGAIPFLFACCIWTGSLAYDLSGRLAFYTRTPLLPQEEKLNQVTMPQPTKRASPQELKRAQERLFGKTD